MLVLGLLAHPMGAGEATPSAAVTSKPPVECKSVDLRSKLEQWGLKPRNQGSRPTCSVFTFAGALEYAVATAQSRGERLSVEFLNWAANQTGRSVRDGGFFSEMWDGFTAHGICAESEMPYRSAFSATNSPTAAIQAEAKQKLSLRLQLHWIKRWNVKTGLNTNEFAEIKRTLDRGWPVCGGLRWPIQEKWNDDNLQMCGPDEVFDGHSVLIVGYRDELNQPGGGVFIFRNTSRGGRDGYMPYRYAQAYINDAIWIESPRKPAQPGQSNLRITTTSESG